MYEKDGKLIYSKKEVQSHNLAIVESNCLIFGPTHDEGEDMGIKMFKPIDSDADYFECFGIIEGGEYITSVQAVRLFLDEIKEINSYKGPDRYIKIEDLSDYKNSKGLTIINMPTENSGLIFPYKEPPFIVNHHATKKILR